jgi:hypothetical protein
MDNEFPLDYAEIIKTVQTADVITFRFVTVHDRLLIDNRTSEIDPPLVKLVPRASSVSDRFRALKKLRPRFKLPDKISAVWWPKTVGSLADHGIWDAVVARIADAGFTQAAEESQAVFDDLKRRETAEIRNAIVGQEYQAIWER